MDLKERLYIKNECKCSYCGREITLEESHLDHVIPKSKNGSNSFENRKISCQSCNLIKSDLSLEEFREKIENVFSKNHLTRCISEFYNINPKPIKFHFEKLV